ncbi:MAG: hypothetical protein U0694_06680 [Anaerolineae bacterium]
MPYIKQGYTYAKRMQIPFQVRLKNGDVIYGAKGDYVCTDTDASERWIVADDIFEQTYRRVTRSKVAAAQRSRLLERYHFHIYRKTAVTWAKELTQPMMVHTLEGPVSAEAGEYLCMGAQGEQWPQMRERFEENYELAEEAVSSE